MTALVRVALAAVVASASVASVAFAQAPAPALPAIGTPKVEKVIPDLKGRQIVRPDANSSDANSGAPAPESSVNSTACAERERLNSTSTNPSGYRGLGAESVPPEVLAQFRAAPLPSSVTRRVQAMLDVRSPGAGVLAPDGKTLFFTWGVTGVRQVWRLAGPNTFPVQMTGGEDATSVVDVTPDGKFIVVQRDQKGEENPGLYLQSVEGGPLIVVQHTPKVQTLAQLVSDDGQYLYFRANDQKPDSYALYRYVFSSRSIEKVFTEDGIWSIADRRVSAAAPRGVLLLNKEVGGNMVEVFEYDEGTKTLTPLFGQGEREDYRAFYGVDDVVYAVTPHFTETRALQRFDRNARTFSAVNTSAPGERAWDLTAAIDGARRHIFVSFNEGGYLKPRVIDAKTQKMVKLPKSLPSGDLITWGGTTKNGRYTVFSVDAGVRPAASYVLDWTTQKVTAWHVPSAPEVDLARFVPVTLEDYPARDGTKIPMFVRRPAACATAPATSAPCPVIVDFHGGPEGQTMAGFSARAQLFVDAGFVYVQPNVRGSDGYGKAWLHADDGVKRAAVVTDIEDASVFIKRAWAKGGVAPKVGVMGGSYGGYSTLMAMTKFAGAYDAGVEIVGISNLVTFLMNTAPYRRALRISEYGDPEKERDALLQLSPITFVDRVKAPLLLIQGATDPRVPAGEAIQMYEAMKKRDARTQMIIFPDEGHGVQKRENAVVMLGHTLAFFEQYLK